MFYRRRIKNERMGQTFEQSNPNIVKYSCQRCRNHGIVAIKQNHRLTCPFLECSCELCILLTSRSNADRLLRNQCHNNKENDVKASRLVEGSNKNVALNKDDKLDSSVSMQKSSKCQPNFLPLNLSAFRPFANHQQTDKPTQSIATTSPLSNMSKSLPITPPLPNSNHNVSFPIQPTPSFLSNNLPQFQLLPSKSPNLLVNNLQQFNLLPFMPPNTLNLTSIAPMTSQNNDKLGTPVCAPSNLTTAFQHFQQTNKQTVALNEQIPTVNSPSNEKRFIPVVFAYIPI
ncbi:hypothetical protein M3Y97_00963800 [Aphelenchoides bicaudatus]|nr:hypothetical protein M3Y97_00963800 [Aphelenchoides bicaudatus]